MSEDKNDSYIEKLIISDVKEIEKELGSSKVQMARMNVRIDELEKDVKDNKEQFQKFRSGIFRFVWVLGTTLLSAIVSFFLGL